MKLLVTGGCGFIGSNFVRHWATNHPQDEINVLDKLTYAGHVESLGDLLGPRVGLHTGDICDGEDVKEAMNGCQLVVHFAAESHVDNSIEGPKVFYETNVLGTQTLLQEALKQKVELFHHVSTDEVFGTLPIDRPELRFNETTPYDPRSPYSSSKAGSDHVVRAYHYTYGLPVTISNTSNNYGPFQDPEKLIPKFITNLIRGQKVPLYGDGLNIRDWIHVSDHCRAIEMIVTSALVDKKLVGETFCVGGDAERTNKQVTYEVIRLLGKDESSIEHVKDRAGHDRRYAIDSTKIKKMLGWKQEHTFEEGLKETVEWYLANESWWGPIREV
ncbi:MAG: dTDP-glucose 4,6-dehydratase [bacterium]|nr:dTDP-glucose 4,6-dehydratase [bacterium]